MYPKNAVSPPPLFATVVKAADGLPITSGVAAKYSVGANQSAGAGTLRHEGNGQHSYVPTQAETNVDGFGVQFYHADAVGTGPTISVVTTVPTRTELATELGRIDAAITSRSTYAGGDTSGVTELLTRIPDAEPDTEGGLPIIDGQGNLKRPVFVAGYDYQGGGYRLLLHAGTMPDLAEGETTWDFGEPGMSQRIGMLLYCNNSKSCYRIVSCAPDDRTITLDRPILEVDAGQTYILLPATHLTGEQILDSSTIDGTALRTLLERLQALFLGVSDGGGTATVHFVDANGHDRITVTLDETGNRLALTFDDSGATP